MSDMLDPMEPAEGETPISPLSRIKQRLRGEIRDAELDLKVHTFAVLPNDDPTGVHRAQAVFMLDDDPKPERVSAADLEAMFGDPGPDKEANAARADAARRDLEDLRDELRDPKKGIGLDD